MNALGVRAAAARELIRVGELDPFVALSFVVWPTRQLAEIPERVNAHPAELRQHALELVAGGASWAAAARVVGVPKTTVGFWVKAGRG